MLDYIYEIFHINKNLDILFPFQYKKLNNTKVYMK